LAERSLRLKAIAEKIQAMAFGDLLKIGNERILFRHTGFLATEHNHQGGVVYRFVMGQAFHPSLNRHGQVRAAAERNNDEIDSEAGHNGRAPSLFRPKPGKINRVRFFWSRNAAGELKQVRTFSDFRKAFGIFVGRDDFCI